MTSRNETVAPVFKFHEVEDVGSGRDEENLHKSVVEGDEMEGEQVNVSSEEDADIECLGFERNPCVQGLVSDDAHDFFDALRSLPRHDLVV